MAEHQTTFNYPENPYNCNLLAAAGSATFGRE